MEPPAGGTNAALAGGVSTTLRKPVNVAAPTLLTVIVWVQSWVPGTAGSGVHWVSSLAISRSGVRGHHGGGSHPGGGVQPGPGGVQPGQLSSITAPSSAQPMLSVPLQLRTISTSPAWPALAPSPKRPS